MKFRFVIILSKQGTKKIRSLQIGGLNLKKNWGVGVRTEISLEFTQIIWIKILYNDFKVVNNKID